MKCFSHTGASNHAISVLSYILDAIICNDFRIKYNHFNLDYGRMKQFLRNIKREHDLSGKSVKEVEHMKIVAHQLK